MGKKIHVELSDEVHRRLRVQVALEDTNIQAYVSRLVADAVGEVSLPHGLKVGASAETD